MTPQEVLQRSRGHWGETNELSVPDTTMQQWVNDAMKELYNGLHALWRAGRLSAESLRTLLQTETVALTGGKGILDEGWDELVSVRNDQHELVRVGHGIIRAIDTNLYFPPVNPVYAERENTLYVRPTTTASVEVVFLAPPDPIDPGGGSWSQEIEAFSPRWHQGLVWLVTSYAYAQEEDRAQADHYRSRYAAMLGSPAAAGVEQ